MTFSNRGTSGLCVPSFSGDDPARKIMAFFDLVDEPWVPLRRKSRTGTVELHRDLGLRRPGLDLLRSTRQSAQAAGLEAANGEITIGVSRRGRPLARQKWEIGAVGALPAVPEWEGHTPWMRREPTAENGTAES
ncbi:hypothetical protein ACFQ07_18045 [Actinomadura adrarensis]|uniref:Uncharacterized protein n=1 Tax=Actinomadura adrarensis TaxID=1819600 RepID=A0ABW3CI01_9ACTN